MARLKLRDDPFPEMWEFEPVRNWVVRRLEGRSQPQMQFLVGRTALRALPLQIADLLERKPINLDRSVDLVFRCALFALSSGYFSLPTRTEYLDKARDVASEAWKLGLTSAALAASFSFGTATVADSATMIVRHVSFADDIASGRTPSDPQFAQKQPVSDLHFDFAAAFLEDCEIIKNSNSRIFDQMLWSDTAGWDEQLQIHFRTLVEGSPVRINAIWSNVFFELEYSRGDFAVWASWYHGVLDGAKDGSHIFGLPFPKSQLINVELALIDDRFWKGEPAALHAEMRRLIRVARGRDNEQKPEQEPEQHPSGIPEDFGKWASPQPSLNPEGKLDAGPHPFLDRAIVDDELRSIPDRQIALIQSLLKRLPKQAPSGLRMLLSAYMRELENRPTNPNLGLLNDSLEVVDADFRGRDAEEWVDEGITKAKEIVFRNHETIKSHFPLSVQREQAQAEIRIDESKIREEEIRKASSALVDEARKLEKLGGATRLYVEAAENVVLNANAALDIRPELGSRVTGKQGAERSEQVKGRTLANLGGFAKRTSEEVTKASVAEAAKGPILSAAQKLWDLIVALIS